MRGPVAALDRPWPSVARCRERQRATYAYSRRAASPNAAGKVLPYQPSIS